MAPTALAAPNPSPTTSTEYTPAPVTARLCFVPLFNHRLCFVQPSYAKCQIRVNSHEKALYQGHAARIADELDLMAGQQPGQAEALCCETGYFRDNQHRINYLVMREEEWATGSGMVESGGKQYKAGFCGPGMPWSRADAEKLLPIRSAILSKRFDELRAKVYNASQASARPVTGTFASAAADTVLLCDRPAVALDDHPHLSALGLGQAQPERR